MAEQENGTRKQPAMGVRRILGVLTALVCIVGIAAGMVKRGWKIYENTQAEMRENETAYDQYLNDYLTSAYVAYNQFVETQENKKVSFQDLYFNHPDKTATEGTSPVVNIILDSQDEIDEEDYDLEDDDDYRLYDQMMLGGHLIAAKAVDYVMLDTDNSSVVKSMNDKEIIKAAYNGKISKAVKKSYPITMLIQYGTDGDAAVIDSSGVDERYLEDVLKQMRMKSQYPEKKTSEIENVKVLLVVHENAVNVIDQYNGYYNSLSDQFVYRNFAIYSLICVAAVFLLAVLLMIFRLVGVFDTWICRIPIEITGGAIATLGLGYVLMGYLTYNLYQGELTKMLQEVSDAIVFGTITYRAAALVCLVVWIVYLGLIFIFSVALLQVFRKGLRRFMRENSILVAGCNGIRNTVRRIYRSIVAFNFEDDVNRIVFKLVLVNALIIAIMCSIWLFGWGVLFVYSIFLFWVMRNYFRKVQADYQKILSAAEAMSNGNLNVQIDEPVGAFEALKEELLQVKEGFSNAVEEEVKSQNLRNELITNVSHDLKTPLTAIITYIDLLKDETISPEQRKEYVATLERKAFRLKQLIEDLFEVSKLNSNNVQLQLVKVDLVSLVKQIQFEYEDKFEEKSIELISRLPEEKVMLYLDSQKTYRIFENLYGNIIKYAMPSTRAYIEIMKDEDNVTVIIKNISEHVLDIDGEMLTERFVRGDASRNTEGSGLGLAIVKSLVEKQGGSIHLIVDGDLFKTVILFPAAMYVAEEMKPLTEPAEKMEDSDHDVDLREETSSESDPEFYPNQNNSSMQ